MEGTAADFWWALLEHETVDAARQSLLSVYDVDPDVLKADLHEFIETAVDRHLLAETSVSAVSS